MSLQFNPFTGTFDVTTKGDTGAVAAAGDGSAAAPGITFASDTNTGIYRPGEDQLALSTNGNGRLFISSAGLVGIGNSAPADRLDITGTLRINNSKTDNTNKLSIILADQYASASEPEGATILVGSFSSTANSIRIGGSSSAYNAATDIRFYTGQNTTTRDGTERLIIDSSGRVGIGTSGPQSNLEVSASEASITVAATAPGASGVSGSGWFRIRDNTNAYDVAAIRGLSENPTKLGSLAFYNAASGVLTERARLMAEGYFRFNAPSAQPGVVFQINSSEVARVDSSGRLLVGTSSARSNFFPSAGWFPTVQIETATNGGRGLSIVNNRTDNNGPQITFGKANGSAIGSADIVLNNDTLGAISFTGADGTNLIQGARIEAAVDGTPGLNDMPGRLVFFTTADGAASPTERLRIDSSGRVGIGTASPDVKTTIVGTPLTKSWSADANDYLVIENSSTTAIDIRSGATAGGNIIFSDGDARQRGRIEYNHTNDELRFGTAGTNGRAILDSSGRLLVGSSSSIGGSTLQVAGTGGNQLEVSRFVTNSAGPFIGTFKSRGATVGVNTAVIQDDLLGAVQFHGAEGTGYQAAANIRAFVDPGTVSGTSMPGRLVFSTTADGAASPTERMRISANGDVLFSTDTIASITSATANANAWSETNAAKVSSRTVTTAANHYVFYNPNGNVGQIQTNGSSTSYNTSSDYRLKENVAPVTDGITRLQQLKPSRFNFIADPDKTVDGFIAHEVQTIVPEAITGEKDAVDDDGNPVYQGIDQSKIVPLLTAALQEAVAKIESLEARLTAAGI